MLASALAGGVGLAFGAPFGLIMGATGLLWLPALAGWLPGEREGARASFQVLGWTLIGVVAVAVSGGPLSPLSLMLVLGPLTGLAIGRRDMALEAAGFSVVGLLALWVLSVWQPLPVPQSDLIGYIAALTLAGLVHAGVLCVIAVTGAGSPAAPGVRAVAAPASQPGALNLQGGVQLPADFPAMVIAISPEGRVRAVQGDRSLFGPVRIGADAGPLLARLGLGREAGEDAPTVDRQGDGGEFGQVRARLHQLESARLVILTRDQPTNHAALAALRAQAEQELRERTAFFAGLGHDLKTPLNAIIGFADMMRAGIRGPLPEAYRDYSEIIHESGQDLLLMVEDLLDLAKADAKALRLDLEPVDLVASAASVVRQLAAQADRLGVRLELDESGEAWAEADARAVRQIWQNLVSNAVKYSSRGDSVRLSVGEAQGGLWLRVSDEGAGMDAEDLERIARPFAQGRNSAGRVGTGLGLAVVKQFADLHGGQVRIDTRKGEGTAVTVSFRRAEPGQISALGKAAQ